MEFIGQALFSLLALGLSAFLSILALMVRPLRPVALAILLTPPSFVFLFFFMAWTLNDLGPVCGPDPEWDHCPSFATRLLAWAILLLATSITAISAYWAQRVLAAAAHLWADTRPISIFKSRPSEW